MSAADRREVILDAARSTPSPTRGYHETSLDAVAERAGVSKALLYEHFSSKRRAVRRDARDARRTSWSSGSADAVADAEARRGADAGGPSTAFFGFVQERRGAWRIMFRNADDPDVAVRLDRLRDEVAAAIVQLMSEEAERRGLDFPKLPQMVEMIAQQMVGAMQSLADWWDLHRKVPKEEVVQAAMDFAWIGQERVSQGERWTG